MIFLFRLEDAPDALGAVLSVRKAALRGNFHQTSWRVATQHSNSRRA